MIRFFRWLIGYVEFCFSGGFIEGFINDCYSNGINITRLDRYDGVLVGNVSVNKYKMLHHIAHKHGGIVKIIKRRGPIFVFLKIKNRWGLFAGFVAFLFIINVLSGFVWNIEIEGNNKLARGEIEKILSENDLNIGSHWSSFNRSNIENYIMSSFSDCSFAHINRRGTTAVVEIDEAIPKPIVDPQRTPTNLKAKKDGIIVKAQVNGGWEVAKVGDSVRKGDLLVSGIYENELNKTNVYANASGQYIAKVREDFSLVVNRRQSIKDYGKTKKYRRLVFFNLKLPLYIGKIDYNSCDIDTEQIYLSIDNKKLPIGIITISKTPYTYTEYSLSDSELTNLINTEVEKQIQNDYGQYEIVTRDIGVALNENEAVASGYVDCLEDIGEMIKITKEDDILCSSTENKPNIRH